MKILPYFKYKFNNKYLRNFLTLFSGSVIGQFILFASIPLLTRMFSKEAFGIFALFSSSIILLKPLISLNYELAIILPKRDKDAINVFAFNIFIIFIFSLLLFLIIYLFHFKIITLLNIQDLSYFVYFIPLSVFFISLISAFDYWNIRLNSYNYVSIGNITKSTTISASQIITGISNFKSLGLIPGLIIGQFFNLVIICPFVFKNISSLKKHVSIKRMLFLASKYKDIPIFNTISTFINTLSNELPVLLITRFFGLGAAGVYGLAVKVSKTPPGIIGQSISQVFFREASLIYNSNQNLYEFIKKTYKTLFVTALIIFIPLFIISFYLEFIFGNDWNEVGIQVRILIPWLFIGYLNSPISSLSTILNKQKTILILNILFLVARFLAINLGYVIFKSVNASLVLFSITGVIFNFIILFYFLKISNKTLKQSNKVYN